MCINGNDIYVVGFRVNSTSTNAGTLWKNGVPNYLESNGKLCHANVITIVDNVIYI
jgi:anaerobic selenocysteine-containing dehydrogenase